MHASVMDTKTAIMSNSRLRITSITLHWRLDCLSIITLPLSLTSIGSKHLSQQDAQIINQKQAED